METFDLLMTCRTGECQESTKFSGAFINSTTQIMMTQTCPRDELEILTHTVPCQEMHMWSIHISLSVLVFP